MVERIELSDDEVQDRETALKERFVYSDYRAASKLARELYAYYFGEWLDTCGEISGLRMQVRRSDVYSGFAVQRQLVEAEENLERVRFDLRRISRVMNLIFDLKFN